MGNKLQTVEQCQHACFIHCWETPQEIRARGEVALRDKALTLSSVTIVLYAIAHIVFAYDGKVLPIPEIIWAVFVAPWCGAAAAKIASDWPKR